MIVALKKILTLTCLLLCLGLYSQDIEKIKCFELLKISKTEIDSIDHEINKIIQEHEYLSSIHGLQKLYEFCMQYDIFDEQERIIENKFTLQDLIDYSFFYELEPCRSVIYPPHKLFRKRQPPINYLSLICYLYDSINNYIGHIYNGWNEFEIYSDRNRYSNLFKLISENEVSCLFSVPIFFNFTYFGIKDGQIVCIHEKEKEQSIYSIEELINCCWESILPYESGRKIFIKDDE